MILMKFREMMAQQLRAHIALAQVRNVAGSTNVR